MRVLEVWGVYFLFFFLFQLHFNITTVIWLFSSGIVNGNQIHSQIPHLKFSSLGKCGHKKFALPLFTTDKWKTLKRQKDLQSYSLTSFRESYCRREHLGYCSESLNQIKRLHIHDLRIRSQIRLFAQTPTQGTHEIISFNELTLFLESRKAANPHEWIILKPTT